MAIPVTASALIFSIFLVLVYIFIAAHLHALLSRSAAKSGVNVCRGLDSTIAALTLSFCIVFVCGGVLNLYGHIFGLTLRIGVGETIALLVVIFLRKQTCIHFFHRVFQEVTLLADLTRKRMLNVKQRPYLYLMVVAVVFQIFLLCYRLGLPVSHGDALAGQYFFESLQISKLAGLSLNDFYILGQGLRSDSLASFFDALIVQSTDNWLLTRIIRALALIFTLIIFLRSYSIIAGPTKSIIPYLFIAFVFIGLPDIWDIGLSGKHDSYVWMFESTGFFCFLLATKVSKSLLRFNLLFASFLIGVFSVSIRFSSLSYLMSVLLVGILIVLRDTWKSRKGPITNGLLTNYSVLLLASITPFALAVFNFIYKQNPFYILSPPSVLSAILPDASYRFDYNSFSSLYGMRDFIWPFKSIISFVYASLGLEPIRLVLFRLQELSGFQSLSVVTNSIGIFGPKIWMVSMLSFSPICLIPLFDIKRSLNRNVPLTAFVFCWMILWGSGIAYTRVFVAGAMAFLIIGVSSISSPVRFSRNSFSVLGKIMRQGLVAYGIVLAFLFPIWNLSTLSDLPVNVFWNNKSRTDLVREFMEIKNNLQNQDDSIPSKMFEEQWSKYQALDKKTVPLLLTPKPQYTYFMKSGIVAEPIPTNVPLGLIERVECLRLNESGTPIKSSCKASNPRSWTRVSSSI